MSCSLAARKRLCEVLDSLLELQATLASNREPINAKGEGSSGNSAPSGSLEDEEVLSDDEASGESEGDDTPARRECASSRKRKRPDDRETSVTRGEDYYEEEIARRHRELRPYCDAVISRWSEKTRLASGRVTSKVSVV